MGGNVTATSVQGRGSTFTITVDPGAIAQVARLSPEEWSHLAGLSSQVAPDDIRLPACSILVVDDGAANRQLVTVYLERAGATVHCGTNGQEAIDLVSRGQFDMVIMDVHMPVMDGMEATRRMRGLGVTIPIIALTGNVMKDDEDSCRHAGYSGFLAKPIRMNTLLSTVAGQLAKKQSAQPAHSGTTDWDGLDVMQQTVSEIASLASATSHPDQEDQHAVTDVITTELPMDDDEIRTIVQDFVVHLRERVSVMERVFQARNYEELEDLAHWLKGAGGSLGFSQFTVPARELEAAARQGASDRVAQLLSLIRQILDRVRGPEELAEDSLQPAN
jgi:CheY-like chemotaxis protein